MDKTNAVQGTLNRIIKPYQIKEAFMDVQVWTLFFFTLLNELMNGGVANVRNLSVNDFGSSVH